MRINKYLASTLLAGFISAAVFTPASGQELMEPAGAWNISKIDRAAQGKNSYCTLSRKYDSGVILSLGRSQTEEYSVAIDFQKPTFEKDKAVEINLQPGPGQIRAYNMMPASDKALVVRLGWDTGFFDALNQSQQMKVKVGDQKYAFALPEIAKGQANLEDCMEELKTAIKGQGGAPAKMADAKDVLSANPTDSSKDFSARRVEDQEKQIVQQFAQSIQSQEAKFADAQRIETPPADIEPAAGPAKKKAKEPAPELVKKPVQTAADTSAMEAELKSLKDKLEKMTAENKTLKTQAQKPSP